MVLGVDFDRLGQFGVLEEYGLDVQGFDYLQNLLHHFHVRVSSIGQRIEPVCESSAAPVFNEVFLERDFPQFLRHLVKEE